MLLAYFLLTRQTDAISLTVRAAPLSEVCRQLSDATHLHLSVKGKLQEEPLILKLNRVAATLAMEKIAQVVDAEWTKTGETSYVLARTNEQEKREYADHIALRS